jgi:hypothetical protein
VDRGFFLSVFWNPFPMKHNFSLRWAALLPLLLTSAALAQRPAQPASPVPQPVQQPTQSSDAQVAAEMRDWLSLPPEKLAAAANQMGYSALAELQAGRQSARYAARERNVELLRGELLTQADRLDQQRVLLFKQVEQDVADIQAQFAESPRDCAEQIQNVVARSRAAIESLKCEAARCRELAQRTDGHLKDIRPKLAGLQRDQRVIAESPLKAAQVGSFDFQRLDLSGLELPAPASKPDPKPLPGAKSSVSSIDPVKQALAELSSLK